MGALMRSFDWSKTPLGPVETWSPALKVTTQLLLANSFPMLLWWGPDFIQIYNDAYTPVLGDKHPKRALGRPFRECWSEVFHVVGPLAQTPFEGGPPTWMEDIPLEMNRFGFVEETHFTIGYSPVPDESAEGGIGGVLATVHEITQRVLSERRVAALRDLGTRSFQAKSAEDACSAAATSLGRRQQDIPFAMIYLLDEKGEIAFLAGAANVGDCDDLCPRSIDLRDPKSVWPFGESARLEEIVVVDELQKRFTRIPRGPWSDSPDRAAVVPIKSNIEHRLAGFLVAGISPRLRFDDPYRGFLELASAQIAISIGNARALEEERKRIEALAEINAAKTTFFANVSHEFRTPLTLMMGPLEDALAEPQELSEANQKGLELAHRNSLRLLKLVNTLLDFSRIESGRTRATYEPVDLASLTADLASVFRSAVERAGLKFVVDCPPLESPVYVDREMWEKIVLNLVSNAFKFTFKGSIDVRLRSAGENVELTVRDSGVGIAAEDVTHIFERFYRVNNVNGRSYEGSGIGLALVQELVKLNGGEIRVESTFGRGTTFTVTIPFGKDHLPSERIGVVSKPLSDLNAAAFLQEALRWLPDNGSVAESPVPVPLPSESRQRGRIVFAEDNSDMRQYVQRLLADSYEVEAVPDGEAALNAVHREIPDLVLTDVMMPKLDGIGLVKALRKNVRTSSIPVIQLSARAGEEARVEGLRAGVDDYLAKPFSARELIARVENLLALAKSRRATERALLQAEKLASLGRMAASISHEINNPLESITNLIYLARMTPAMPDSARDQLQLVDEELKRIAHITRQSLGFYRESSIPTPTSVDDVLDSAIELMKGKITAKQASIYRERNENVNVLAVPGEMRQVFSNLLANSLDAIEERGSIRIRVATRTYSNNHRFVRITIADSGKGISPQSRESIFEPFFTTKEKLGTGLGLWVVKQIVDKHSGTIRMRSRSESAPTGTVFSIALPIEEPGPFQPQS